MRGSLSFILQKSSICIGPEIWCQIHAEIILLKFKPRWQPRTNLHIQDLRERSPVANDFHPIPRFFFSEHPQMDYPAQVRKSANLHIQDYRHGLIYISTIEVNALQSSIFIRSSWNFLCTPSDKLSWLFPCSRWPPWANLHLQVANIHPVLSNCFLTDRLPYKNS